MKYVEVHTIENSVVNDAKMKAYPVYKPVKSVGKYVLFQAVLLASFSDECLL